jgi:hypothetical protein
MPYVKEEFNLGVGSVADINEEGEKVSNSCLGITVASLEQK